MKSKNSPQTEIIFVSELNELAKHENAWNELILRCPGAGPTQTYTWLFSYFSFKLKKDTNWVCLFAYENSILTGVFPLVFQKRSNFFLVSLQTFIIPFDSCFALRTDGLILPEHEYVFDLLLRKLKTKINAIPLICIFGVPEFSTTFVSINSNKEKLYLLKNKQVSVESYLDCSGNFQNYVNGLSPKFCKEFFRKNRRLNEKHSVSFVFRDYNSNNKESFHSFIDLESSGWKCRNGIIIKRYKSDIELFETTSNKFFQNQWMEWNFIKADEVPISGHLAVRINRVLYIWKIGFNEDFSYCSPGCLLLFKLIENAFQRDDIDEINLLSQYSWMKEWNLEHRKTFDLIVTLKVPFMSLLIKYALKFYSLLSYYKRKLV